MSGVARLREVVARLRAPDGCPWDREQTHDSLRASLIEECYEVIDAIEKADDANLQEELGDLLLQVVMHAQLADERGAFTLEDIATTVCDKMIRRHPHVFGESIAKNSTEVLRQWEQIKRQEKGGKACILDGIPTGLPALLRAQNTQKKAARVGFDWNEADPVFDKIHEELVELREEVKGMSKERLEDELGDVLFSVVNLARKLHVDSEMALARATGKFTRRFQAIESLVAQANRKIEEVPVAELEEYWEQVKGTES